MKSRKRLLVKTRKRYRKKNTHSMVKRNGTRAKHRGTRVKRRGTRVKRSKIRRGTRVKHGLKRGGAYGAYSYHASPFGNANDENDDGNDGNNYGNEERNVFNNGENDGYRNGYRPANGLANVYENNENNNGPANGNENGNANNANYNADDDTDDEYGDEQNYEDYQGYIEELTEGWGDNCTTTTLDQKLEFVEREIEKVSNTYDTLVQGIADQTLGEYTQEETLHASYSAELSEWHRNAVGRAREFQRISEADLNRAFLYLLPGFNTAHKYMVLNQNDEDTPMHVMIKNYAYKMITALFTRANITYAVIQYDDTYSDYQFMENLLWVMSESSQLVNQYLREDWNSFLEIPMDRTMFVLSGGNMTVMLAGMMCYLHKVWNSGHYEYNSYGGTLLEQIRQEFETELVRAYGTVDGFYQWLSQQMFDPWFRNSIRLNTEKVSDIDMLFMGPDYMVNDIANPYLFQINELTAYVLRKIMVAAHSEDGSDESAMAYHLMPFAGSFDENWPRFKFSNFSEILPETVAGMRDLHEEDKDYEGYRQTSNLIEDVPMYLNRIKQGYQPFFDLDLTDIPEELRVEYSKKYGECLDCSIGAMTNHLYAHKQVNYIAGMYYTLDTLIFEFDFILQGPRDDKYQKRVERRDFLNHINIDPVNALFQIIGRKLEFG